MKKLVGFILALCTVCWSTFAVFGCSDVPVAIFDDSSLYSSSTDTNSSVPKTYEVSFHENGGAEVSTIQTSLLQQAPKTTKSNCVFDGWYLDRDLTNRAAFPLEVHYDLTLYAKWLNLTETKNLSSAAIKNWTDYESKVGWFISPSKLNLDALKEKGYRRLYITVYYDVYYEKDYEKPFDIGYMGSPKYEAYLQISEGYAKSLENLETTKQAASRSFSFYHAIEYFMGQRIYLVFSTDNIQNIVHFTNIRVEYECTK